jgi:signal transduction histidine kinase
VLDVNLSLAEADLQIARDQRWLMLLAALAIAASSLMLWLLSDRLVVRPVRALIEGTRKVAEGDLHTTLVATGSNEIGDLGRAFNDMIRRLGEAQRQLTQAEKLASVGRLAAGVAHEINNPLTGVLTYASFLQKRAQDRPEMAQDLEVIVRETKRCRDIVRGLLDFSRQTPPQRRPTDLNEVVRRAVAVVMNQLALDRVKLDFQLDDLPEVSADANQLQQVAVNLVLNASDALGGAGGTIHVRTAVADLAPRGHAVVRSAACPKGCDLIDPTVRIGRFPGIRVLRRQAEHDVIVYLDPVYGRVNHRASEACENGTVSSYCCSRCRTRLDLAEVRCEECGSPAFGVQTAPGERIEWCTRKGCHWTRWRAADARGSQRLVELSVADTGQGITAEDLEHLFEPFFTTKGNRGLGLGLAVSWGIVEGHGGTIDVESKPGQGTCFTVRLPLAPRAVPIPVAPPPGAGLSAPPPAAPRADDPQRGAA